MLYIQRKETAAKATLITRGKTPCLLVDFITSTPPLVWQLNLKNTRSLSLLLKQDEQGEWDLGYETDKAEFKAVAHFDERGDAEDSYEAVQKVIGQSHAPFGRKLLRFVVYFVLIVLAIGLIDIAFSAKGDAPNAGLRTTQSETDNPRAKIGVPVAADDILPKHPR